MRIDLVGEHGVDVVVAFHHVAGVTQVSVEELFRLSDVISLHCPLTNENKRRYADFCACTRSNISDSNLIVIGLVM